MMALRWSQKKKKKKKKNLHIRGKNMLVIFII